MEVTDREVPAFFGSTHNRTSVGLVHIEMALGVKKAKTKPDNNLNFPDALIGSVGKSILKSVHRAETRNG